MRTITKNAWRGFCMAAAMTAICSCTPSTQKADGLTDKQDDYYVAAYIWPSCHNDPMGQDMNRIGQKRGKTASGYISVRHRYQARNCNGCPLSGWK